MTVLFGDFLLGFRFVILQDHSYLLTQLRKKLKKENQVLCFFHSLLGFWKKQFMANKEDKPGTSAVSCLLFKKVCDSTYKEKSNNLPCGPGKLHKLNFSEFNV